LILLISFTTLAGVPVAGQQAALTAEDYARAERFMSDNTTPLVLRSGVRPTWLEDGRFWYRVTTENGTEAFLVDPVKRTKVPCDLPQCKAQPAGRGRGGRGGAQRDDPSRTEIPSPDGTRVAFVRDHNLWVRDVATKKET